MIETFRMGNFKCFKDRTIDFGKLTMFSGLNGMGKSSVIQGLLVLRQSHQQGVLPYRGLALNGDIVSLGTARDILYEAALEEQINFDLSFDNGNSAYWEFGYGPDLDFLEMRKEVCDPQDIFQESLFNDNFQYLHAERLGPRSSFPVSDYTVNRHRQLGIRGEFTTQFISLFGNDELAIPALCHPNSRSSNLKHQLEAWLGEISPGVQLEISSHRGMDIVNLQYSFALGQRTSNTYRSSNVGFGVTYVLPILTAILSARPSALILIENPEAHLHPRGQVKLAELMALASSNGVQIIVETHSDHILNGIRLAVHSGKTTADDVRLYYFERQERNGELINEVVEPKMDSNGRIDVWPSGFFDELDNSLMTLLLPREETP